MVWGDGTNPRLALPSVLTQERVVPATRACFNERGTTAVGVVGVLDVEGAEPAGA